MSDLPFFHNRALLLCVVEGLSASPPQLSSLLRPLLRADYFTYRGSLTTPGCNEVGEGGGKQLKGIGVRMELDLAL
jgi:hypothetical protein